MSTQLALAGQVPCLICGAMVPYAGDEFLSTALVERFGAPAACCQQRDARGRMDPACCYMVWQRRLYDESTSMHRTLDICVRGYLQRDGKEPPADLERDLLRSGFGDQWIAARDEWRRRRAEKKQGRSEEVD